METTLYGRDQFNWRRRSNHPGNSQAKGPYIITLERRLSLTEGANLSGKKTDGVLRVIMEVQKTALYKYHKSLGAKFVPFAGYQMPVQYTSGIVEEHKLTRSKAGLFDVSHMGQLFVENEPDLIVELEKIIPIDLKNIKLNQSKYSFLTNENGGIYDDLIITKISKGFNIILNAACKENDYKIIKDALGKKFNIILYK